MSNLSTEPIFYVYVYLNPLKSGDYNYENLYFEYEPFYIGAGKNGRYLYHLEESKKENFLDSNKHKINIIKQILKNNLEPIIIKLKENLNYEEAFSYWEKYYIKLIGRDDLGVGPLTNLTDGGDGLINPSEETRNKLSISFKKTFEERYGLEKGKKMRQECSERSKGEGNPNYVKIKKEVIKNIINLYFYEFKSPKEISNIYNIGINKIRRILKENNIKMRTISESKKGKAKPFKGRIPLIYNNKQFYTMPEDLEKYLNLGYKQGSIKKGKHYKNIKIKYKKIECPDCKRLIATNTFNKHRKSCKNIKKENNKC